VTGASDLDELVRLFAAVSAGDDPHAAQVLAGMDTPQLQDLFMTAGRLDTLVRVEVGLRIRAKRPTDR
jgi:hypothetical protein